MNPIRKGLLAATIGGSLLAGGAIGATVFGAASSGAATTQTSTSTASPPSGPPPGPPGARQGAKFKSNEDPAHEAKESAQREKEETEGKFPTTSP
jgi:hypothetical protein